MRRKLAVLLALCMTAGTIGNSAGIQEVRAAEVQATERMDEVETEYGEDIVAVETEVRTSESGDFEYAEVANGTRSITKYIGSEAEVVIPSEIDGKQVSKIEKTAFQDCNGVVSITIPNSVTVIGTSGYEYSVFSGCSNLREINIEAGCAWYSSQNGVLYNEDGTKLLCCPAGKEGSVEMLNGITEIGSGAFVNCGKITSITIPESFSSSIYGHTFEDCVNLKEIIVEDGNTTYSSDNGILYKENKQLICCPAGKEGSVEIPNGITAMESSAFVNCGKITAIAIPESFTWYPGLGYDAHPYNFFVDCISLKEIIVEESNTTYASNNGILYRGKQLICCPSKKEGSIEILKGTTMIGENAFANCSSMSAVTLPDEITSIGTEAFWGCSGLESITIPKNVSAVGDGEDYLCFASAFIGCSNMKAVYVDKANRAYSSIDGIVYNYDMTTLLYCPGGHVGDMVIPEGIEAIGEYNEGWKSYSPFEGCNGIIRIIVPESMKHIEIGDFSDNNYIMPFGTCSSLEEIIVTEGNENYSSIDGILYAKENGETVSLKCCPPGKNIDTIIMPQGVSIAPKAFTNCSMQSLTIKGSGTIWYRAFTKCDNLQEVIISGNDRLPIGRRKGIFDDCKNIKKISITNGCIEPNAFSNCSNLQEVIISGSRSSVSEDAFSNCNSLESVTLLDLRDKENIEANAFSNCNKLHIYCEKDSAGQEYAIANNIPYTIIERKEQTITASDIAKTIDDESFPIGATTNGDGELSYTCYGDEIVTISEDGIVTIVGEGTAWVEIAASSTLDYTPASKEITITVSGQTGSEKKNQTITASDITATDGDKPFSIGAATDGSGELTYESNNESVAAIASDGTITVKGAGTAQITISASETEEWKAAQKIITITVNPKQPGESEKLEESEKPEETQKPEESEKPEESQKPEETEKPDDTEEPEEELLPQTITAKDIKKTYGAKSFSLNAKASGGGKLSYSVENKKVARIDKNGKVTITGCGVTEIEIYAAATGKYNEAEKSITLTVAPKKLTVTSAKSQKSKSVTVKWKKDTKASGYIIEYSTDKNFRKGVKTAIVSKNKTTSKKVTKLKAGKKYYIRVCAYATADGEKIKGAYSKTKTVKVKK